jgi:hypothetical protein
VRDETESIVCGRLAENLLRWGAWR